MRQRPFTALLTAVLLGLTSCSLHSGIIPLDPGVNFAAHKEEQGLVIDKADRGAGAMLRAADCDVFCPGPQLVLSSAGSIDAAYWLVQLKTVVRTGTDPTSARLGEVEAVWEEQAIRLHLDPEGEGSYATGTFERIDGGYAALAIGQPIHMTPEVAGLYRGQIVDEHGAPAGWLRVRVTPRESPTRIYDGVLPASLNGPLGAAAVARLDAAIDSAQRRAINPYLGN